MFGRNKDLKKTLKYRSFLEAHWITNFWFINDDLYLTDALVGVEKSMLAKISVGHLKQNLEIKSDHHRIFITSPLASESSVIDASFSDVKIVEMHDGYISNVTMENNQLKVTTINEAPKPKKIISTITIDNNKFDLTADWKIKMNGKEIYSSIDELVITSFGTKGLLVSSKETKELFYLFGENYDQKDVLYTGNHFIRLACYKQDLIMAKPLWNEQGRVNYYLPPVFIY